ncbi:MAG: aminopeptidase P family N-terminal domain-containing protein, partial [Rhodobacterales bacterium]|nr:aminopeptidase P family N-terminal domain-containing protein [Rhodobacterales bacterium]MDX5391491.1 aminopeptidase P family N-terminal domain-containing protein [Rhodobacterales bacterium]MDX5491191.1 aminopeptidase P family N-terminal domain-containing protein [Rhodobacterales bacterium]
MNQHYSDRRKIDPTRGATLADGSPNDMDRVEIGPTLLAFEEWAAAGLSLPDLPAMRQYRFDRLVQFIQARDYAGLLMFDPLNIRYATDSTNMQLWNTHNPFRAVLICADGYMVIWDYKNAMFLSRFNPLVREQRSGADLFYFDRGDKVDVAADVFANEVRALLEAHAGGNRRLAVDKIMLHGLRALEAQGLEIMEGEELTEKARSVKGPDEILAMRCASHACEAAVAEMERAARSGIPGGRMSEDDVWAVLHAENIRRGGEWIETRLLASGPRTNPWFQECG